MHCSNCDSQKNKTLWTRRDTVETKIRRRQCLDCGNIWFTLEMEIPKEAVAQRQEGVVLRREGYQRVRFW